MLGKTLSHYRILEEIAAGGMGVVYLAHDERLERDVALKALPPGTLADEEERKRFRREALTLSRLNHPNIAIIFDFDTRDGIDFLVTEYVSGVTLDNKLAAGPLNEHEILRLGIQLADGLAAAHAQGIVHRDLKPPNLRLTSEGRLKILDFGLAQLVHSDPNFTRTVSLGTSQQITGTLPYMAPEQLRGQSLDARSDIWSSGAVLYEMATGKRPFVETNGAMLIDAILNRNPAPPSEVNPNISPGLNNVVLKALEKDPAKRHQTSRELGADLERLTTGIPLRVIEKDRRGLWTAAALAAVLMVLAGGWVFLSRRSQKSKPTALAARRSVAVLGFKNLSGRPDTAWLSTALSEMLTTELAAGENLLTISGENVARVKTDLSLPEEDTLAADTLARIHENLGSDFVVLGSYLDLGGGDDDQIRLDLRLQDAAAGQTVAHVLEKGSVAQLDAVITRAGAQLRSKLGAGGVMPEDEPAIRTALPSNLKASRLYSEGLAKLRGYDVLAARDLLVQAVAADPKHVPSLVALSSAWSSLGYDAKAAQVAKQAYQLSPGLPLTERLLVEGQYFEQSSQWEKAIASYQSLFDHEPDDLDYGLKLANAQISSGQIPGAQNTLARLRALPAPHNEDLRIDLAEGRAASSAADFKRQLTLATGILEKGKKQNARLLEVRAGLAQCAAMRQLGDLKGAVAACQHTQELAAAVGDRMGTATAMNNAANALYDQGDTSAAQKMYESAMQVYREIGNMEGLAGALDNIASIKDDHGDHDEAMKLSTQALLIYRETGDLRGVGDTLNNIGTEFVTRGDMAGALPKFSESLKIWQEMGNSSGAAISLTNLGDVRMQLSDIAGAKSAYTDALAAFLKGGEKSKSVYPRIGLGDTLLASGDLAEAKKNYQEGLAIAREVEDKHESSFALAGLAEAAFEEGDIGAARKNAEEALAIRTGLAEKDAIATSNLQLAGISLEEGRVAEAESFARKSISSKAEDTVNSPGHAALAEVFLAQHKATEAQREAALSRKLADATQLRQVQWQTRLVTAKVEAATGNVSAAISSLEDAVRSAEAQGLTRNRLEAQLSLGQIEVQSKKNSAGSYVQALQREAAAAGFVRIAIKAEHLLTTNP